MTDELTPELRRQLGIIGATLPMLEAPDFSAGSWVESEQGADGVWSMPYFERSEQVNAFTNAVGASGLFQMGFAWPDWAPTPEAVGLRTDRDVLAHATPDQLGKLLTMLIREDRFYEGALAHSFDTGLIAAIARRAKVVSEGTVE